MLPRLGWCTLSWNEYQLGKLNKNVHVSMLDYVPEALIRFQHVPLAKPQHQPCPHVKPVYGETKQYVEAIDTSPPLSKEDKNYIQEVVGTFLDYARCVNSTMLTALGSIVTQQLNPTENTIIKVKQFLDYALTHPDAIVTYHASGVVLAAHSDASYLSETNPCSQAGGHFFMSNDTPCPQNNGAVLTIAQIIKAVMSLAAKAKTGAHQLSGSSPCLPRLGIHGSSPTTHTNSNQQHNSSRHHQQQRHEETKSHGHEVPLALGQNQSETIPTLLGTGQQKQRQLRHQTSRPCSS
jgi:hypothetical protein